MFDDDKTRGQEPGFYRFGDFASRDAAVGDAHDAAKAGGHAAHAQAGHDHADHDHTQDNVRSADLQDDGLQDDEPQDDDPQDEPYDAGFEFGGPEAPQGEIDQVREILFGGAQRATEQRLRELEESLGALRSDMMRLFADLEARVSDGDAAVERRHMMATQGIGSALSEIGAQILKLSGRNSG